MIETERLLLRRWRFEDRWPFAAMNADAEVMRYFPGTMSRGESDALVWRIAMHFEEFGFGLWATEVKASGAFIGFIGAQWVRFPCPIEGDLEIGWRLARPYWRKGYAYEGASACLGWIWRETEVPRIVSMTARTNEPSWSLMKKLGLEHRPALDFDHPRIDDASPLKRHVVYVKDRPQ